MNDNFYAAPGAELEPPRLPGDMGARKANRAARLSATLVDSAIVFGLFVLVDTLMIFGEERRCVHDYMADTIVVHT